ERGRSMIKEVLSQPPYYAVIITSKLKPMSDMTVAKYLALADSMYQLAQQQPGFLGMDYARDPNLGITVSYWRSVDDIEKWQKHPEHVDIKAIGRQEFYDTYDIRICLV